MTVFGVAALGVCIGIAAGILGAGPSMLTVLLLCHAVGLEIRSAIATSLVVVALMSLTAIVPYAKAGAVLWRTAVCFGIASMLGAVISGHISMLLPTKALVLIFFLAMMVASVAMLCRRAPSEECQPRTDRKAMAVLGVGGLMVGALTGLVGLGGGFAVVPLLVCFARAPVRSAVGTSILVIAMNTLAGLAGHLPHPPVVWRLAAYLGVAESAGSLVGARLARRVGAAALRRTFAITMLLAAMFMLGKAVIR